jgi:hypothetical protein
MQATVARLEALENDFAVQDSGVGGSSDDEEFVLEEEPDEGGGGGVDCVARFLNLFKYL